MLSPGDRFDRYVVERLLEAWTPPLSLSGRSSPGAGRLGRRLAATAANLVECVLPTVALRQWVLTVPFAWRKRRG